MASRSKSQGQLLHRRTILVLVCLVVSMTGVSGLLLALEPTPLAPVGGPMLTVLNRSSNAGMEALFRTDPAPTTRGWKAIVIHHSGRSYGNAQSLGERHQARGDEGLGYHFVVGNGDGAGDGEVQVGYRWTHQLPGRHVRRGESADWYNRHAIGICLIGDGDRRAPTQAQMRQLVRLVTALQERLDIPARHVLLHQNVLRDPAPEAGPGLLFPATAFRQQLIEPVGRTR